MFSSEAASVGRNDEPFGAVVIADVLCLARYAG
ncbi:hypothetical protein SAMN05421863_10299 [Nitrosomonas communis]|uniref:Uncharacterized protein n=1 Tax=Nitrosomonas communis TaxID=44574 RepID=A0A1I4QXV6_9PROT|nr:hypothetical protein SAMN05421863_10299 [Nitrosomonas communis]